MLFARDRDDVFEFGERHGLRQLCASAADRLSPGIRPSGIRPPPKPARRCAAAAKSPGCAVEHLRRELARPVEQQRVGCEVGEAQQRRARLARAEELARAADLEVAPRDLEAVGGLDASPSGARAPSRRQRPLRCDTAARRPLAAAPRPTRPRSWCSCDRPKRSACSITISDALGTSTPTSITVVATSTLHSLPPVKSAITACLLGRRHARRAAGRRCTSGQRRGERRRACRSRSAGRSASLSSISGQTQ